MKKCLKIFCKISSLLLAVLIVASVFAVAPITTNAAEITKSEKSYDIAVVFDNSGSMYMNEGWCRAKYAMEIFASMLNYEKDRLQIFPMWEVTTDGSKPSSGGSYEAFEITSKQDIDKISNLYTVHPSGTPFAPVTEAHTYLKGSGADEKWLIVLTDGAFNQEKRNKSASINLQKRLSSLASSEIKVQYLGFGGATSLKSKASKNFFTKKSSDSSLKDDLIGICNSIFQRSVLPKNRLKGSVLTLDLSMKNVIVFAQGSNAKITSLKNSKGEEIKVTLNSGQRKYSTIKAKGYESAPVDKSLAGQVVTFAACEKGEYRLTYSGAQAIQIFYEPDVDMDITMTNSDGQVIDSAKDFVAGEYKVESKIVDRVTGEDVTNHELMGKDVDLKTNVKTSKDGSYKAYDNGATITFEPDDETEICVEGEYLGKYKISSKDDPKWAWLNGLKVDAKKADVKAELDVLQNGNWYKLSDHENWGPIKLSVELEGQPLTDTQLANTVPNIQISDGLIYRYEALPGESAFNIYIAQNQNGKYIEPKTGSYKIAATATYTDDLGVASESNTDKESFEIRTYAKWLKILGIIALILFILAAIIAWLIHPVLPKYVTVRNRNPRIPETTVDVDSSFSIMGSKDFTQAVITGTPKTIFAPNNFWVNAVLLGKRSEQSFKLQNIGIANLTSLNIDGENGKIVDGKWMDSSKEEIPEIIISNESTVRWQEMYRGKIVPFNGTIEIG